MANPLIVGDSYRKNMLSKIPGGATVTLHMESGHKLTYDKIKNMEAYLRKAFRNPKVKHAVIDETPIYRSMV